MAVFVNNMLGSFIAGGSGSGSGSGYSGGSGSTGPNGEPVTGTLSMTLQKYGYSYGETFNTTYAKVTFNPYKGDPIVVYDPSNSIDLGVSFEPSSGTELTETGDVTVTATYRPEGSDDIRVVQIITVAPNPQSGGTLSFTPAKTSWSYGEAYTTAGAVVKYTPTGGNEVVVWDTGSGTDLGVSFEPSSGTKLDTPGQITLKASYTPQGGDALNRTVIGTVSQPTENQITGRLEIQLPKKEYKYGETFNTSNVTIMFYPSSGSPVDVTLKAIGSLNPSNGTEFNTPGDVRVTASYTPAYGDEVYGDAYIRVAEQTKGILTATMSKTSYVHGEQFNYSVVTVKYFNPTTGESSVLDNSTVNFSPSNGSSLDIDGPNKLTISYSLHSDSIEDPDPISLDFVVTSIIKSAILKLGDNGMRVNESTSYKGSVLTVTYSDNSTKDILYGDPNLVWSPLEGTKISSAGSENISVTYTENSQSVSASAEINVTALNLVDLQIDVYRTQYYAGDNLELATATATAYYDDESTKDVTDSVKWNKSDGSTVNESFTLVGTYTENSSTRTATVNIEVVAVEGEKGKPGSGNLIIEMDRSTFKVNESFGTIYSYAHIKCPMTDGTFKDVTSRVSWQDGANVKVTSSGNLTIRANLIIFDGSTMSGTASVNITNLKLTGLGLAINRSTFSSGDVLNYTSIGAVVKAMYEDGSTKIVENTKCSWNPSDGTNLTSNNTNITVTYSENDETKSATRAITVSDKLASLSVVLGKTEYVPGELLSFDGSTIIATFESGKTRQLQASQVNWTPAPGTRLNSEGSQNVVGAYTFGGVTKYWNGSVSVRNQSNGGGSESGGDSGSGSGSGSGGGSSSGANSNPLRSLSVSLAKTSYEFGETISYSGATVTGTYKNGETKQISPSSVTWEPAEGSSLTASGTVTVTATYGDGDSQSWSGSIEVSSNIQSIQVTTPPNKVTYNEGETIDFTGLVVTAYGPNNEEVGAIAHEYLEFPVKIATKN